MYKTVDFLQLHTKALALNFCRWWNGCVAYIFQNNPAGRSGLKQNLWIRSAGPNTKILAHSVHLVDCLCSKVLIPGTKLWTDTAIASNYPKPCLGYDSNRRFPTVIFLQHLKITFETDGAGIVAELV